MVRYGFPRLLHVCAGAVTGSGARAGLVIVVGGHKRAAGRNGCHVVAGGLVETLGVTPHRPLCTPVGGGDRDARPRSPRAEETTKGYLTTKACAGLKITLNVKIGCLYIVVFFFFVIKAKFIYHDINHFEANN